MCMVRLEQKLHMDRRKTEQENSWNRVEITEDTEDVVAGEQQCFPDEDEIRGDRIFIQCEVDKWQ